MLSHNSTPAASSFPPVASDGTLAPAAPLGQSGQSARPVAPAGALPGPHSTGPVGTAYRQYCGRCDGSGTTEDGIQCPKCGGAGTVVNQPAPATPDPLPDDWQAFRGLTVRDRNGDAMVWRENGVRTGYYPVGTVAA